MTYTLWSNGDQLGESELDYVRVIPNLRTGDLHLNEKGLRLMERLCQYRADAYYTMRRLNKNPLEDSDRKTLDADLAAQQDQYEALALELRAPDGSVIPTDDIYVSDTEYLIKIGQEAFEEDENELANAPLDHGLSPDDLKALEDDLAQLEQDFPPWMADEPAREPVRFQISVMLKNEWSIP